MKEHLYFHVFPCLFPSVQFEIEHVSEHNYIGWVIDVRMFWNNVSGLHLHDNKSVLGLCSADKGKNDMTSLTGNDEY